MQIKQKHTIINVIDPQMLDSFLTSLKGQKAVYKVLNRQINKRRNIMRTRDEINKDIKTSINNLNLLVEASVKCEQDFEETRDDLEDHIKVLDMEVPFENTLAGRSYELTVVAKRKIKNLLHELEQKTGIALQIQFVSESKDLLGFPTISTKKRFFAFPHEKEAFRVRVKASMITSHRPLEKMIDQIIDLIDEML